MNIIAYPNIDSSFVDAVKPEDVKGYTIFDIDRENANTPVGLVGWLIEPLEDEHPVWAFEAFEDSEGARSKTPYLSASDAIDALLRFATTGQE